MASCASNCVLDGYTYIMNTLKDNGGRSNFNKSLQYFTKLLSIQYLEADAKSQLGKDLNGASGHINTARKISVLGGWMEIFYGMRSAKWSSQRDIVRSVSNLCNGVFVAFDNIVVLNRIKLTDVLQTDSQANKIAMCAFWFAQLFGLAGDFMDYQALMKKFKADKKTLTKAEVDDVKVQFLWFYAAFIARCGNMVYSANGWNLSDTVLGAPFSEKTCAYAGLIAGVLNMMKNASVANAKK